MMETSEKVQNLPLLTGETLKTGFLQDHLYRDGLKRIFDFFLAILILPIVLPILFLLLVLIRLTSRGTAIYKSERIGRDGRKFACLKLRTMCENADEKLEILLKNNPGLKKEWEKDHKLKNDPRVTKVGRFIRALSLDEVPQIFNVLKGEMSFVGPRPIVEAEIEKYGKKFIYFRSIRPGITGLWQINGRNDTSYEHRVDLDTNYSQSANFFLDLKILVKTVPAALSKRGAY